MSTTKTTTERYCFRTLALSAIRSQLLLLLLLLNASIKTVWENNRGLASASQVGFCLPIAAVACLLLCVWPSRWAESACMCAFASLTPLENEKHTLQTLSKHNRMENRTKQKQKQSLERAQAEEQWEVACQILFCLLIALCRPVIITSDCATRFQFPLAYLFIFLLYCFWLFLIRAYRHALQHFLLMRSTEYYPWQINSTQRATNSQTLAFLTHRLPMLRNFKKDNKLFQVLLPLFFRDFITHQTLNF